MTTTEESWTDALSPAVPPVQGVDVEAAPDPVTEAAHRAIEEASGPDEPVEVDPHVDRTRESRTPGFSRMNTEWNGPDWEIVVGIRAIVEGRILHNFGDAFVIMNDLFEVVRSQAADPVTSEALVDAHGFAVWERNANGSYVEDWTALTNREREGFMLAITSRLLEWEQAAADAWGQAMFAKGMWEERFARSFDSAEGKRTVEDRTQRGRMGSLDERYLAIFESLYSKKADALCRSMERLAQRLKDVLP